MVCGRAGTGLRPGQTEPPDVEGGLVVVSYARTLRAALLVERERLKKLPDVKTEG